MDKINLAQERERYLQAEQKEDSGGREKKGHTAGLKTEGGTTSQEMLAGSKVWKRKETDSPLECLEGAS